MVTVVCKQHGQTKSPKIQFCNVAFGSRIVLLKTTKKIHLIELVLSIKVCFGFALPRDL